MDRKWWTLLASCIAIFMLLLDVTIVNVALPSIERDLGANFSDLQWVIDAYALTLPGLLLAAGSLAGSSSLIENPLSSPSCKSRVRPEASREGEFMRFRLALAALAAVLFAVLPTSAGAIIGGQPDGNNHPYVAYSDNGVFSCSATLLSPTVMLTAAHCFSDSTSAYGVNTVTGGSIVRTTFDPDLTRANPSRIWHWGTYYFDPQFAIGSAGGLPGFDTHDVAIIVFTAAGCHVPSNRNPVTNFCGPISLAETGGQHGVLPPLGLVDTLRNQTPVDLVGYGVRNYVRGGGPCGGPCTPVPGDVFTRYGGQANVFASNGVISSEFLKLHANKVGVCHGDSGGPDLVADTNIILAVNSFGGGRTCNSNTYSYRVDTQEAQTWIANAIRLGGGSL